MVFLEAVSGESGALCARRVSLECRHEAEFPIVSVGDRRL